MKTVEIFRVSSREVESVWSDHTESIRLDASNFGESKFYNKIGRF